MVCGKAVAATPAGGVLDVVEDHENEILVPANDAEVLSSAILELLENESLRSKLGSSARKSMISKFKPEKELEANLNIYRRMEALS